MKKMLFFLVILAFAFSMNTTFAQGKNHLGIGANLALPIGSTFSDQAGIGFGGTASFEMEFTPNITGIATAGYISFGGKDISGPGFTASYGFSDIPILAGIKYYFTPGMPFYGIGQVGLHFLNSNYSVSYSIPGFQYSASGTGGSTSEFGLGAGVGYEIPVGLKGAIDVSGMIHIVSSSFTHIGVRAAYRFGI